MNPFTNPFILLVVFWAAWGLVNLCLERKAFAPDKVGFSIWLRLFHWFGGPCTALSTGLLAMMVIYKGDPYI